MFSGQPILTRYTVPLPRLPKEFAGFTVALLSDLHGQSGRRLEDLIQVCAPDLIAVTGDLVDSRHPEEKHALALLDAAVKIAPCYYVPGNHESRLPNYPVLRDNLLIRGVTVLEDSQISIRRKSQSIRLLGLLDPAFPGGGERFEESLRAMSEGHGSDCREPPALRQAKQ